MFGRLFGAGEQRVVRDPAWAQWGNASDIVATTGNTYSGVRVTPEHSLEAAPVLGCASLIADVMATVDVRQIDRRTGRDVAEMVTWLDEPQRAMDWPTWMFDATMGWVLDGEIFLMPLTVRGRVEQIAAIDADRVTGNEIDGWKLDGQPVDGLVHRIKWRRRRGDIRGTPVVDMAREVVGAAIAAQRYGGAFFGQSAIPPVVLELPGAPTAQQMRDIRENWVRHHAGPGRAHLPGVITGGGSVKQLTVSPEQAQFLQTRRFIAAEIATNLFHLPPDVVGVTMDGASITYQNIGQRWTEIIRSGVMPWMTRWRHLLRRFLPATDDVLFLPDAYQAADTATRFATWRTGIEAGFLTVEEARRLENLVESVPVGSASGGADDARAIAEVIQKIYLGVGVMISADEARAIVNRGGAGLSGSFPGGEQ
jgi:HK97 family phage portal protein